MTMTPSLGGNRRKAAALVGSFSGPILVRAARDAVVKLDPRKLTGNPVIFATEIVAILATASAALEIGRGGDWPFAVQMAIWLWATVVFANFAESIAVAAPGTDGARPGETDVGRVLVWRGGPTGLDPAPARVLSPPDPSPDDPNFRLPECCRHECAGAGPLLAK